jgi:anti-sigma regulatory factor (Ser/Thr protein kinase)
VTSGTDRWELAPDLTAAGVARRHVDESCADLPDDTVDVARLLVTELVANAVKHGAGSVLLEVDRGAGRVEVSVHDESPDQPVVLEARPLPENGAGLRLVAALASRWGVTERRDGRPGKRVWFTLGR